MEPTQVSVKLAKEYKELFNPAWRHIIYHGGRASGKSTAAALTVLLRGRQTKLRVLCTREFQNSLADSVHAILKDLIAKYQFTDYEVLNDLIRNRVTGTEIIFKGLRKDSQAIKSTEGIDLCWVEEAQTITESSIELLVPTIRKEGSQIIWTFNRLTELDPVYTKFCMRKDSEIYVAEVNSDVLERIGQLPQTVIKERERDREHSPESFGHIWLGQPVGQAEQSIISRDNILLAMDRQISDDGAVEVGVDVARMGNDRSVFWKRKGLKTVGTESHTKLRLTDLATKLEAFVGNNTGTLIKVDDTGVGGGLTDIMIERGYNVMPINFGGEPVDKDKYPNWISEAWFHMATIMPTIELPMDKDLLMELSTRQWRQDNKGRRGVESKIDYKKRGFRSPDLADACIIAYYTPPPPTVEFSFV